jgi:hypothetical protein
MAAAVMPRPLQTIEPSPALVTAAPASPPINAWELLEGMPSHHVIKFQQMAPMSAPKMTAASTTSAATIPVPTVCATWRPKNQKGNEIKERGPENRILWAQHAGRNHGRDRIGGIMQAIQQVEDQRDRNQREESQRAERGIHWEPKFELYTFSMIIPLISFATSSNRSITISRWP